MLKPSIIIPKLKLLDLINSNDIILVDNANHAKLDKG